jgi:glycine/D-amino acid oxidase-like deaminating enzyme
MSATTAPVKSMGECGSLSRAEEPLSGALSSASIWIKEAPPRTEMYAPLTASGEEFDVAVIGAGIVGVTTAYLLKREGKKVALIEGRRIGRGTTGFSTVKLTSQQSLTYTTLIAKHGVEAANLYLEFNEIAIRQVEEIVNEFANSTATSSEWSDRHATMRTTYRQQQHHISIDRACDVAHSCCASCARVAARRVTRHGRARSRRYARSSRR